MKDWKIITNIARRNIQGPKRHRARYSLQQIFSVNEKVISSVYKHLKPTKRYKQYEQDEQLKEYDNPIEYIDGNLLTAFMVYESVPKGTVRIGGKSYCYTPKARVELLRIMVDNGYDPTLLPALSDRTISVGAYQMRRSTFNALKKLYPSLLTVDFEETLGNLKWQSLSAALLLYDQIFYFIRNIYKKDEQLKELFTNADIHEKRKFLASICAAMFNSGPTDVRNTFERRTSKREYKSLEHMRRCFIDDIFQEGGIYSAPYAEYMGELYFAIEQKNESIKPFVGVGSYSLDPGVVRSTTGPLLCMPLDLKQSFETSDTDALYVERAPAQEMLTPLTKRPLIRVKPIIGKPGRLLFRVDRGIGYYTFTMPNGWSEEDLAVLLIKPIMIRRIKEFNKTESIKPGDIVFIPVHLLGIGFRDGQFATINIGRATDKTIMAAVEKYCKPGTKKDKEGYAKIIKIYSNIKDSSQTWIRIPSCLLKNEYTILAQSE